jgi:formate-dependent nitrite reductase membrane component NrfD
LGALFLLAPGKLHPLWYTPYLPVLFFVSAIFGGLSMVIVESTLVYRFLRDKVDPKNYESIDSLTLGLGKAASFTLFTYFCLKVLGVAHSHSWHLLNTSWGTWFLLEMFGFVLLPCFFFLAGVRNQNVYLVRFTAFITVIGIAFNRLTVSLLASSWRFPEVGFFHGKEFIVVLTVITIEVLVYRWVVNRMPVHREDPKFPGDGH